MAVAPKPWRRRSGQREGSGRAGTQQWTVAPSARAVAEGRRPAARKARRWHRSRKTVKLSHRGILSAALDLRVQSGKVGSLIGPVGSFMTVSCRRSQQGSPALSKPGARNSHSKNDVTKSMTSSAQVVRSITVVGGSLFPVFAERSGDVDRNWFVVRATFHLPFTSRPFIYLRRDWMSQEFAVIKLAHEVALYFPFQVNI